jgi:hypothetical protein
MEKPKLKRLLSLTQSEMIGLDDDEYIKVNMTQLKKKIFLFIGNAHITFEYSDCLLAVTHKSLVNSIDSLSIFHSVSFGYMLNGFAVGWSSNISADDERSTSPDVSMHDPSRNPMSAAIFAPATDIEYELDDADSQIIWPNIEITPQFQQHQISWIISAFPFGVVIMSIILCKCYYAVGTKVSILSASLLINVSWLLIAFFG